MTRPVVSFVISVYNGADFLGRSLDSALAQTYQDFEVVVVDDGSKDQTANILRDYQRRDSRIRPIFQQNQGLTRALINGCAAAQGEFIARQDADDCSHPGRLQQQIDVLRRHPDVGFVSCPTEFVGPSGEYLETVTRSCNSIAATKQLLDEYLGPPAHGSVTFRRVVYDQVGGYRPEFYFAQDSDLWLRMAEVSHIGYTTEVGYTFVRGVNSITGKYRTVQRQFGLIGHECRHARLAEQSEQPCLNRAAELTKAIRCASAATEADSNREVASALYALGSQLQANGNPAARKYLREAIRKRPLNWKAWVRLAQSVLRR